MSLINKKIVICRRPEQVSEMVNLLKNKGAKPFVFQTFELKTIDPKTNDIQEIQNLKIYDWLILGSENGVKYFSSLIKSQNIKPEEFKSVQIAVVGQKTKKTWNNLYPKKLTKICCNYLQELLNDLSNNYKNKKLKILNPTSIQSLDNIHVDLPTNINLKRIAIYQAVPFKDHPKFDLDFIRSGAYDVIFYGSPSSFDYFLHLAGKAPFKKEKIICVPGKTTASHIQNKGFKVSIIPETPNPKDTIQAIESFYSKSMVEVP